MVSLFTGSIFQYVFHLSPAQTSTRRCFHFDSIRHRMTSSFDCGVPLHLAEHMFLTHGVGNHRYIVSSRPHHACNTVQPHLYFYHQQWPRLCITRSRHLYSHRHQSRLLCTQDALAIPDAFCHFPNPSYDIIATYFTRLYAHANSTEHSSSEC
jgi:hypothetical protein